jgi:DNA repair protein Rad10
VVVSGGDVKEMGRPSYGRWKRWSRPARDDPLASAGGRRGPGRSPSILDETGAPFISIAVPSTRSTQHPAPSTQQRCPTAQCLRHLLAASMDNRVRAGNAAATAPAAAAAAAAAAVAPPSNAPKVQQPKPQALPSRSGPSSILVSPRQKGNPILNNVRSVAWEYSDIPADYVVGATTCALFLSLKYHRLHPEYIYNRIRDLKGQYNLRILLTMVDIESHEEPLKELSKTSLVNNVTVMLCWSAQEAGRYLELFKTFENAAPASIRGQQSSTYSEKMVDFITVPRSINKTDAVGLVSNFGSIRTAINAGPEEIGLIAGWGDKKVQRWANAVREPFRVKKAGRRTLDQDDARATMSRDISMAEGETQALTASDAETIARDRVDQAMPLALEMGQAAPVVAAGSDADSRPDHRPAEDLNSIRLAEDEEALREAESNQAAAGDASQSKPPKRKQAEENLSEGVMAALSRLRKQ